jgi:hypothetical protein
MYRSVNDPKRQSPYDLSRSCRECMENLPKPYPVLVINESVKDEVKELFVHMKKTRG